MLSKPLSEILSKPLSEDHVFGELMASRINLKQLSAHLGLTEGTVSRALNNYPDISAKTRERVQKAAQALGYKANPTARRLATGIAEAVAYIMPENANAISEPFVASLLAGLAESLAKRGWDMHVVQASPAENGEDLIQRLISSHKVSGVVLSRPHKKDARIKLLQDAKMPFIVHGRSLDNNDYAWYDVDSKSAFMEAVDHLVALGHHRIGFIGAPTYHNFAQTRLDGYKEAIVANGIELDSDLIQITELSDDGGERVAHDLLDLENPPTALLCLTDTQAFGALAALHSRGLVPGKHVSVIGYDGLRFGRHTNPPLTTMAQPQAHSGRQLGDMILSIIDGDDPKKHQVLRRAELVRRKSDGPVWTEEKTQSMSKWERET